jgi:hypothetical protein
MRSGLRGTESHIGVVHFLNLFHSARNLLVHRRRHGYGQPKRHMLLRFDESNGRGMLQLNALRQVFDIAEFSNRTIATVIIQWSHHTSVSFHFWFLHYCRLL